MTQAQIIEGPFRTPRNMAQTAKGSIHDDATASKLGFKGGTVAGSIHMDQFAPQLVEMFGEDWFKTGNLSMHFVQATVDEERVRAVAERDGDRAKLTMFNENGDLIAVGTARLGEDAQSELALRLKKQQAERQPTDLRILAAIKVGDEAKDIPVIVKRDDMEHRLETITEDLPLYRAKGVLAPSLAVHLAHHARSAVVASAGKVVGLFGALQVQHVNGPLTADTPYLARSKVYALSESPRTENVWYEITLAEKTAAGSAGRDIARVMFFLRFLKGSSEKWAKA
jgi:hypothetical protein